MMLKNWRLLGKPISRQLIEELIDQTRRQRHLNYLTRSLPVAETRRWPNLAVVRRSEDPYKFIGLLVSQLCARGGAKTADGKTLTGYRERGWFAPLCRAENHAARSQPDNARATGYG